MSGWTAPRWPGARRKAAAPARPGAPLLRAGGRHLGEEQRAGPGVPGPEGCLQEALGVGKGMGAPGEGSRGGRDPRKRAADSCQMETGQKEGAEGLFSLICVCFSSGSARCAASAGGQTDLVAEIAAGRQERAQVSVAFFVALSADRLAALACEKGLWEGPAVRRDCRLVMC